MAMEGGVYAAGTEDMDALTFKTPILVRKMTFANATKSTIQTVNYQKAIEGLELTHEEFVDLCILMGCDYCDTIRGVGPKTALKLIRQYKNIETILKNLDRKKYTIPDEWLPPSERGQKEEDPDRTDEEDNDENNEQPSEEEVPLAFEQARQLFLNHEVTKAASFKWGPCKPDELTKFLVDDMGFNPDRVKSNIEKLQKAFTATSKPQMRMDSFFTVKPSVKKSNLPAPSKKRKESGSKVKSTGKRRR
eukprot:CAMPEP_0118680326 /NCGR_PEP_ID=MMETSP0800-20121206/4300_1 /TAXON_ID=210618 ORGANISM="Striatella unipunctata, Strain CCMP2910" /NCGR_SAMPLE_ID=MMETSP0800 /ASSEMBLY_ACC=CAM_ASM_000638 /LENGTH=247 /DNA_ID=CAMNT_0006576457 /DNA_START=11 /DNA_END=754 /DNA_ORIENTATION=-